MKLFGAMIKLIQNDSYGSIQDHKQIRKSQWNGLFRATHIHEKVALQYHNYIWSFKDVVKFTKVCFSSSEYSLIQNKKPLKTVRQDSKANSKI